MESIEIGALVRVYYDQDTFDEGEIRSVAHGEIEVDFYDWIERWSSETQFAFEASFYENIEFLLPLLPGEIIADYRSNEDVLC